MTRPTCSAAKLSPPPLSLSQFLSAEGGRKRPLSNERQLLVLCRRNDNAARWREAKLNYLRELIPTRKSVGAIGMDNCSLTSSRPARRVRFLASLITAEADMSEQGERDEWWQRRLVASRTSARAFECTLQIAAVNCRASCEKEERKRTDLLRRTIRWFAPDTRVYDDITRIRITKIRSTCKEILEGNIHLKEIFSWCKNMHISKLSSDRINISYL